MTHIITGRLQQQDQVQQAIAQLVGLGFPRKHITSFYLNPPGQHDLYPIGGDRDESPGSQEASTGAVGGAATGGVIGAAVGMAGAPFTGGVSTVLGALVGAHIGSLFGSLSQMKEHGETEPEEENTVAVRHAGMIVAVLARNTAREDDAIIVLKNLGADQIERSEGSITEGSWEDFDPLTPPNLIEAIKV